MIQMNDDYYECLTPKTTVYPTLGLPFLPIIHFRLLSLLQIELLEACKRGKPPPMGKWGSLPMNGQISCEGPLGKTSLKDGPPSPPPMRTDLSPKVDPASVKAHMHY